MGIGVAKKILIVTTGETNGVDGIEPNAEQLTTTWAQVSFIDQTRAFEFGRVNFRTGYEFIIRYDSNLDGNFNSKSVIEYDNRRFALQNFERVDRLRNSDKFKNTYINNPNGRYWRVVGTAEDLQ